MAGTTRLAIAFLVFWIVVGGSPDYELTAEDVPASLAGIWEVDIAETAKLGENQRETMKQFEALGIAITFQFSDNGKLETVLKIGDRESPKKGKWKITGRTNERVEMDVSFGKRDSRCVVEFLMDGSAKITFGELPEPEMVIKKRNK